MHENDLYMILECENDLFTNIYNFKIDNVYDDKKTDELQESEAYYKTMIINLIEKHILKKLKMIGN